MRRSSFMAVSLLTGLLAWACGGDDEGSTPAPSDDAGPASDAPAPASDATPDAPAPPRGKTAGKCGATERSLSYGSAAPAGLSSGEDEAVAALAADSQNNLFVAGWTRESPDGGTKLQSLLLEKRDPSRAVVWRKIAGDDSQGLFQQAFTRARAMAVQANGGLVVGGAFAGTLQLGGAPLVSAKQEPDGGTDAGDPDAGDAGLDFPPCTLGVGDCFGDAFVARFDPADGAHTWSVRFGGANGDAAAAVAVAPDGSIFAAGTFELAADFGATTLTSAGKHDAFVVHLDADGNVLGAFQIGGTGDDGIRGLAIDPSGDVIVAGYYSESITVGSVTHTATPSRIDAFVAKLSETGEARWSKSTKSSRGAVLTSVTTDPTGNVYVGGSIDGTFEFAGIAGKTVRYEDAFLAQLDGAGALVWSKLWGNDNEEAVASIALGADGSLFVTGATDSLGGVDFGGGVIGGGFGTYGGPFFVELTSAGDHVCSRSYPGGRTTIPDATLQFAGAGANAVVAATPTSFAAGGSFVATLDVGKGTMTSQGGNDLWIADFAR
jgi:hypothetical protein